MTGLYERSQALSAPDDEARADSAEFAYCELLRSGVTTPRRHLAAVARLGRAVRAKRHARLSRARLCLGALVHGRRPRAALRLGRGARPGRLRRGARRSSTRRWRIPAAGCPGVVSPMQIDTCTADLLRDSHDAARERGLPFTLHVAQSVIEVREMIRRHGKTPVQWAHSLGHSRAAARSSATRSSSTRIPGSAGTPKPT